VADAVTSWDEWVCPQHLGDYLLNTIIENHADKLILGDYFE